MFPKTMDREETVISRLGGSKKLIGGYAYRNFDIRCAAKRAFHETRDNGWTGPFKVFELTTQQEFFAVRNRRDIISLLIFTRYSNGNVSINIAWTDQDYRKKGYYNFLFKELVASVRKDGGGIIKSAFHHTNEASRKMQERQGRTISKRVNENGFHTTAYKVEKNEDSRSTN